MFLVLFCDALFSVKSMVPPPLVPCHPTSAASPYCSIGATVCYFLFFSDCLDFLFCFVSLAPPVIRCRPLGPSVSVLSAFFVSVVSALTHQLDKGLLVFCSFLVVVSSLSLRYPLLVRLPSVWSSCDVLVLVRQLDIS